VSGVVRYVHCQKFGQNGEVGHAGLHAPVAHYPVLVRCGYYGPEREWGSAEPEINGKYKENNYGGHEKERAQVLV